MNKNDEIKSDWNYLDMKRDMRKHVGDTAHRHYRRFPLDMSKHHKELENPSAYVDYISDEIDGVTKNNPWKNESRNMNKKLIRLTESDLHRIVKESVRKVLAEADPRSWDVVARRYDQTDPQKAAYARQRAAQQWNNIYGIDDYSDEDVYGTNIHSTTKSNMSVGDDGNYPISQSVNNIRTKRNGKINNSSLTVDYNPKTQIGSYTEKGSSGMKFNPDGNGAYQNTQQGDIYLYGGKKNSTMGKKVAQQMAQGNGAYDKSKGGWQ